MSLFDVNKLKVLEKKVYEECNVVCDEYKTLHKYRQVFSSDDYDYVEDCELIKKLDAEEYL